MSHSGHRKRNRAFTLVELLVVIAIIGILIALLVPAVSSVRETARRSQCSSNLRQLAMASTSYESTRQRYPSGGCNTPGYRQNEISLLCLLLPYLEQRPMHQQMTAVNSNNHSSFKFLSGNRVKIFLCPSAGSNNETESVGDQKEYTHHYYGIAGPTGDVSGKSYTFVDVGGVHGKAAVTGMFGSTWSGTQYLQDPKTARQITDIQDGLSNTFAFGEISWDKDDGAQYRHWARGPKFNAITWNWGVKSIARPINSNYADKSNEICFGSSHPAGANFVLADGSTRFISEGLDGVILDAYGSIAGEEIATFND